MDRHFEVEASWYEDDKVWVAGWFGGNKCLVTEGTTKEELESMVKDAIETLLKDADGNVSDFSFEIKYL